MQPVRFVGEAVTATASFVGADNQPVAATGVVFKVQAPSGAVSALTPAAVPGQVGRFRADVLATEPGVWRIYGECTGPTPSITEARMFRAVAKPF